MAILMDERLFHFGFKLHFPLVTNDIYTFFMSLLPHRHLGIFSAEVCCQILCLFKNWAVFSLLCSMSFSVLKTGSHYAVLELTK